jgi:4-aminobutyrate aminotransferase-like enzyme
MSALYPNVDEKALSTIAESSLLNFGTSFLPDIITHAKDVFVYTASGRKILDWTSGQMSCLVGHGHPEVVQTIKDHAANLDHLFSGMISPPVIRLAEKLTGLLPEGLDKAIFLSTGGESNEAAIKLAKVYTGKWEIVGMGASWHGMTGQAIGAQYHSGRAGYGPMVRESFSERR